MLKAIQQRDRRETFIQLLFWLSLTIIIGCQIAIYIPIRLFVYIADFRLHHLAYLLLSIRIIFFAGYSRKQILGIIVLLIPLVYCAVLAGNELAFIATVMVIIAAGGIDYREIAAFMTIFSLFVLIIALGLTAAGYLEDIVHIRTSMFGNEVYRHSYGFPHPNSFAAWIMVLSMSLLQWLHGRIKWWHLVAIAAINLVTYYLSNSRAAIVGTFLLIVGEIVSDRMENKKIDSIKVAVVLAVIIIAVVAGSYFMMLYYNDNNAAMRLFNKLFSGRLDLSHRAFLQDGISVFGQEITFNEPLDSLFAMLIIGGGVIVSAVFILIKTTATVRAARAGAYYIAFACIAILAYNTMENIMFNLWNLPLFAATAIIGKESTRGQSVQEPFKRSDEEGNIQQCNR